MRRQPRRWSSCYAANAAALGRARSPTRDAVGAGRGQHRHGQRQLPRAVDPPDDRGGARPDVSIHTPEFAELRRRRARATAAVLDGAKAMAMTVVDLWADPALLDARRAAFAGPRSPSQFASTPGPAGPAIPGSRVEPPP